MNIPIHAKNSCQLVLCIKLVCLLTWESCMLDSLLVSDITNKFFPYIIFPEISYFPKRLPKLLLQPRSWLEQTKLLDLFTVVSPWKLSVLWSEGWDCFSLETRASVRILLSQEHRATPILFLIVSLPTFLVRHDTGNIPLIWNLFFSIRESSHPHVGIVITLLVSFLSAWSPPCERRCSWGSSLWSSLISSGEKIAGWIEMAHTWFLVY